MQIITRALSPRKEEKRKEKEKRKERNELKITSIYIDHTIYKSSFRYFRLYIYIYIYICRNCSPIKRLLRPRYSTFLESKIRRRRRRRRRRFRNRYCSVVERNRGHARFPRRGDGRGRGNGTARKAAAWIVVASKTSRIRSIVPRRELQLGVRTWGDRWHARTKDACHATEKLHQRIRSVYDAANTSDGRRLNFRTVRTGC